MTRRVNGMKQTSTDADHGGCMADMGVEATVSEPPQEFRDFTLRERWEQVLRDARISAQQDMRGATWKARTFHLLSAGAVVPSVIPDAQE